MIQSDKLAYLTDLSGSRGRTSGETALSATPSEGFIRIETEDVTVQFR